MKKIGIIENIQSAIDTWNKYLEQIWNLLSVSPQSFRGGGIWTTMVSINGSIQAIGFALLVLFFVIGVVKSTVNISEIKRPEVALRLFIRFALAKAAITYGMDIIIGLFDVSQGIIGQIMGKVGSPTYATIPQELVTAVEDMTWLSSLGLWAVSLLGSLTVIVLSFIMLYTVYARFIRLYLYAALAPIPLSTFAGQGTSHSGVAFLKSYAGVCLEGAIIVIACIIFSAFASSPPHIDPSANANSMMWSYFLQLILNLLILVGSVKMASMTVREMMGL